MKDEEITLRLAAIFNLCQVSPCAACVSKVERTLALIRTCVSDRDMEWWRELALIDTVAPTPEAVKKLVIAEFELAVSEAVEDISTKALKLIEYVDRCQLYGPADACRSAAEDLRDALPSSVRAGEEGEKVGDAAQNNFGVRVSPPRPAR